MQAFARSIVDTVRHPLAVLDPQMQVVATNAPFRRIFRSVATETTDSRPFDLNRWCGNAARLRSALDGLLHSEKPVDGFEIEFESPDIGRRALLLTARRVSRDEDGAPMILLSIEDETERRKAWDELRRLNEELEARVARRTIELETANRELLESNRELTAANRELEAFCYSVSHDLRTPLRAVDGFSQELLETYAGKLDDQGHHYLERIRTGIQRMGQLIDDLLQLSRLTRADMRFERVELSALAESVVAELRQREPERSVACVVQPDLAAECDARLIRIALENLLRNAWKFTGKKAEASIEFGRRDHDGRPAFFVRDNGAGFDSAFSGKLFGAFQRLHSDREFPGTGIGLATVQRVVRRHGGDTWAEGSVGQGATFYFTLPGSEPST